MGCWWEEGPCGNSCAHLSRCLASALSPPRALRGDHPPRGGRLSPWGDSGRRAEVSAGNRNQGGPRCRTPSERSVLAAPRRPARCRGKRNRHGRGYRRNSNPRDAPLRCRGDGSGDVRSRFVVGHRDERAGKLPARAGGEPAGSRAGARIRVTREAGQQCLRSDEPRLMASAMKCFKRIGPGPRCPLPHPGRTRHGL